MQITLVLVVPVGLAVVLIFALWSVLTNTYDLTHIPILIIALVPMAVAVVIASGASEGRAFDPEDSADLTALVVIIALVALSVMTEVFSHEIVGYRHTLRVVERQLHRDSRRD
jgi:hypothetical protein